MDNNKCYAVWFNSNFRDVEVIQDITAELTALIGNDENYAMDFSNVIEYFIKKLNCHYVSGFSASLEDAVEWIKTNIMNDAGNYLASQKYNADEINKIFKEADHNSYGGSALQEAWMIVYESDYFMQYER